MSLRMGVCVWLSFALGGGACDSRALFQSAGGGSGRVPAHHRPVAVTCPAREVPDPPCPFAQPDASAVLPNCYRSSDCHEGGRAGHCVFSSGMTACQCAYDVCSSDADCHGGSCVCQSLYVGNACVAGGCHVDADCGAGGHCSPNFDGCGPALVGYECHTPKDECVDDADCAFGYCGYDRSLKGWKCRALPGCIP